MRLAFAGVAFKAFVFISDKTSNGKKLAMALTFFKKAVELFTDEADASNTYIVHIVQSMLMSNAPALPPHVSAQADEHL